MKKSLITLVAVAAVALFGASVYASPYYALDRLKLADAASSQRVLTYRSWSEVAVCEQGRANECGLVFRRTGLWSWKLVGIELPQALPAMAS